MSVESIATALHHSKASGTAKVVLLGIANHDGDGGAWPTIATLAKYANVDRRSVQRSIEKLESLGEIRRLVNGGGNHTTADWHRPNLYEFRLACPPNCDGTKHHRTPRSATVNFELADIGDPLTEMSPGATTPAGEAVTASPKPSLNQAIEIEGPARVNARDASTSPQERCPNSRNGHTYVGDNESCAYCGISSSQWFDPDTNTVRPRSTVETAA